MTANILLWLDSVVTTDEAGQASICQFLFQARQWFIEHSGRMDGFAFPGTKPWWYGRPTPFKTISKPGCRLLKVPIDYSITQTLAVAPIYLTLKDERAIDVFGVWMPGGQYPGWFVVFQTAASRLVCLADECVPLP